MKALTVKSPWSHAIARFGKTVDNRSRRPPASMLGQRFAIHVGQAWWPEPSDLDDHRDLYLWTLARMAEGAPPDSGLLIATARLVGWVAKPDTMIGCWSAPDAASEAAVRAARESPWFTGPCGWVLDYVRALREPVGYWTRRWEGCGDECYPEAPQCALCDGRSVVMMRSPIRGQLGFWTLPDDVAAAVQAQEPR